MNTLCLFLLLFTDRADRTRPALLDGIAVTRDDSGDQTRKLVARHRQQQFEKKFEALSKAMNEFARRYRESDGQVWPQREAENVRKAMRELENTETVFRGSR